MEGASDELAVLQRALASVYKVERLLVRRGTMVVYQATEVNPPRPVALRVFPPELNLAPVSERFRELARLLVSLNHPNILPVYRIVFRGGVPYLLATKLVEGRHLDEILAAQGPLHLPLVLTVLRATAAAIAHAHERGTPHGALTTAQILLDRDGHVLLENFGVARAIEDAGAPTEGAPRVAIPEEAAGAQVAPAGDQYAFGIVALELLSGSGQFGADPQASLREVRIARVALPDALMKILQTVLASDPTQRFANAGELLAALQAIAFGDAELREATVGLGRLARGEPVPKLRAAGPTGVTQAKPMPAQAAPPPLPLLDLDTTALPSAQAAPPPPPPPPAPPPPPPTVVEPPQRAAAPAPAEPVAARVPSSPAMRAPAEPEPAPPIMRVSRARDSGHLPAPPPPERRSRLVPALGALVVLAAVAGGAYWLGRRSALAPAGQAPVAQAPVTPAAPRVAVPESARADAAHPAVAAADTAKAAAAPKTGVLKLDASGPRGVFIFMDDKQVGRRGRLDSAVTAGRHHLEVVATGYQGWDTIVVVPAGDTLDLGDVPLDSVATAQPAPAQKDTGGR